MSSGLRLLGRYISGYHFLPSSNSLQTVQLVQSYHPWAVIVASESSADAIDVAEKIHAVDAAMAVPVLSYTIDSREIVQMPAGVEWFTKPVEAHRFAGCCAARRPGRHTRAGR